MAITQQNTTPFDSDAQRFILAACISNKTQKRAINYLVQGLKANNLWVKMAAVYPMVGANVWSCKFNLKNPIDSDLAFRLNFVASPTITNNGVDWNGTTQYANTFLNSSTAGTLLLNSTHMSYYSRENTAGTGIDMGATIVSDSSTLNIKVNYFINTATNTAFANTNTSGHFILSRTTSTLTTQYKNGASVSTSAAISTVLPNGPIYIGCRFTSSLGALNFSDRQCAFASIGSGLTAAEALIFYNIVQQFQIIINRAV